MINTENGSRDTRIPITEITLGSSKSSFYMEGIVVRLKESGERAKTRPLYFTIFDGILDVKEKRKATLG